MKITKTGGKPQSGTEISGELALINNYAKTELKAEEVYTFSVLLCDNEIDRDFERFTEAALAELAELFVGKTGICDHEWRSELQIARIYRTELLTDSERRNSLGTPYMYIKGHCYMLRTDANTNIIAEIEGGIKRETSIGCSISASVCSVCGEPKGSSTCTHVPGHEYGGVLCYSELQGATDAYEWSFVAVPAQRAAGVMKRFSSGHNSGVTLRDFVQSPEGGPFAPEYDKLLKQAETGRRYLESLRRETLRLSLLCDRNLHGAIEKTCEHMGAEELELLRESLETRLYERFPPQTQLPRSSAVPDSDDELNSTFQI